MPEKTTVVIMAAGHGTRMRSSLAKPLHPVCGRPMVEWVAAAARDAGAARTVCVTRAGEGVAEALPHGIGAVEQIEGEGTASAVLAARAEANGSDTVLVLSGDHPLIAPELVAELLRRHRSEGAAATMLTTTDLDPAGYGRVIRSDDGAVERIVETKDEGAVTPEELAVREINVGAYAFAADPLFEALDAVSETGGERYLTSVFPLLRERGLRIAAHTTTDTSSALGVNTRADLMDAQSLAQRRILERHAEAGVTFVLPDSVSIEADVEIGADTTIGPGVTLRGSTKIGSGCEIGPHTTAIDAVVGDRAVVLHSWLHECEVGEGASVGPFAHLRPGARIGANAKIGTFVEIKNSDVGPGAKVPHLSYLGDAEVGEGANIAAGNITANYDGRAKHRTTIGKGARTGVNTSFVAPVTVGDGAYTGAGSVIDEDVPPGALGISRPPQQNVEGYAERAKGESGE